MLSTLRFWWLAWAAARWVPPPDVRFGLSLDPADRSVAAVLARRECNCHAFVPLGHLPARLVGRALDLAAAEFRARSMCGEGRPLFGVAAKGWDGAN